MSENQQEPQDLTAPPERPGRGREAFFAHLWTALSWVRDLAFSVLIAVVSIVFIYQPVKVFQSNRSGGYQLFTMLADGSEQQPIPRTPGESTSAAWSPRLP